MERAVFNREFDKLQLRFEHPVKPATAIEYYEQTKGWAEPDLVRAVQTITDDEGIFPKLKTLKDHLRRAVEARKVLRLDHEEVVTCEACGDPDGLVWQETFDAKGRRERGTLLGRCLVCHSQRRRPYLQWPLVDPVSGQAVAR